MSWLCVGGGDSRLTIAQTALDVNLSLWIDSHRWQRLKMLVHVGAAWPLPGGEDELAHSEPGGALLAWTFQEDQFESCKGPWGGLLYIYVCVCVCVCMYVCVCICVYGGGDLVAKSCPTLETAWTVTREAPLSMAFSRQENWSGLPFPSLGHIPDPGLEPTSPVSQVDSLLLSYQGFPYVYMCVCIQYIYLCIYLFIYICMYMCVYPFLSPSMLKASDLQRYIFYVCLPRQIHMLKP